MSKQLRSLSRLPATYAETPSRDTFFQALGCHRTILKMTSRAIKRTCRAFYVEATVGLQQYSSLKKAVETFIEQLHTMLALVEPPDQLPDAVRPYRYALLIAFRTTGKQAEELLRLLFCFRSDYFLSSSSDVLLQRSIFSQAHKLLAEYEEIDFALSAVADRSCFLEKHLLALE